MTEIFNFNGDENVKEECCDACKTTDDYLAIAIECETPDELRVVLRNLYDDAHLECFKDATHEDIHMKIEFLKSMDKVDEDLN